MRVKMKNNFPAARKDVATWATKKHQAIRDVVNESAINIQSGAKGRVRVDTGYLRSQIVIEPARGSQYSLQVGTKVFYGPYVEWGTGKFATHPTIPPKRGGKPWAFPVSAVKRKLKLRVIEVGGTPMYLTHGMKAKPFLMPSFEEEKPKYLAEMRRVLRS